MQLRKSDFVELKMLSKPPEGMVGTVKMFFVLVDSFGVDMHPKFREAVDNALKGNAPIGTKVKKVNAALNWTIIKV